MNKSKFKSYVANKLAADPKFSEKYFSTDAEGNKTNSFTPEIFAEVNVDDIPGNGHCKCDEDKGRGVNCGSNGGTHCSDQEGHSHPWK
ncbi:MAG: hypothetical protein WCO77_08870 [bacterium]